MKYFLIILTTFTFLSCSHKIAPTKEIIYKDSIVEKKIVTVKDTTIYIKGDTVTLHDSIACPDYHKEDSSNKTKIIVDIKKGKLTAKCETDSLIKKISWLEADLIKEKYSLKKTVVIKYVKVEKPVRYTPRWHWLLHFVFIAWLGFTYRKSIVMLIRKLLIKV